MTDTTGYSVGRGKPPVHSRFKKGQSGNPGGKPGPAKRAKLRFRQHFHRALGENAMTLARAEPKTALEEMANRLVVDAAWGKTTPVRVVLSLLDAEIKESETFEAVEADREAQAAEAPPAHDTAEQNETATFSLLQGKTQGKERYYGANATSRNSPVFAMHHNRLG